MYSFFEHDLTTRKSLLLIAVGDHFIDILFLSMLHAIWN